MRSRPAAFPPDVVPLRSAAVRTVTPLNRAAPWAAAVVAALLCGCSKFESQWRSPAMLHASDGGDPLEGRWKGSWKSTSGHSGGLRAIITKVDDDTYHASFRASYALMLKFEYAFDMEVEKREDGAHFTGSADLGKMAGGAYHYDGHADGKRFYSTYRAASDHGHFNLARPK